MPDIPKQADRWHTRDLPVLLVVSQHLSSNPAEAVHDAVLLRDLRDRGIVEDNDQMMDTLQALHPTYIRASLNPSHGRRIPSRASVEDLTDAGRQATGLWPTVEDTTQAFLEALERAEEQASEPGNRKALKTIGKGARSLTGGLLTDLIAAVIVKQSGVG